VNIYLIIAAALSAIASALHIGCIFFGAPWYRFFGAGEQMAKLSEQGNLRPTLLTSFIVIVLATWSLYALSGSGLIAQLPFLTMGLCVITGIYLARGVLGFFLMAYPLGRSPEFWLWSSAICLVVGIIHLIGLKQVWSSIA
jgi:hypothetical protein